jgi:hypothetical protein
MGHIVNPISHRLGASKCWNSVWPNDLNFTSSFSSLMKSDWDFFLFFKRFFEFKILMQGGYIFSHVKIIRERQKIFCIVYFYDGSSLERSDNIKQILLSKSSQLFNIKTMFFISLYSFLKIYQWNIYSIRLIRNFKFDIVFNFFQRKKKMLILKQYLRNRIKLSILSKINIYLNFFLINSFDDLFLYDQLDVIVFNLQSLDAFFVYLQRIINPYGKIYVLIKNCFVNVFSVIKKFNKFSYFLKNFFLDKLISLFLFSRWFLFQKLIITSKFIRCGIQFFSFNRFVLHYFSDAFFVFYRIRSRLLSSIKHVFFRLPFEKNLNKIKIILKKLEVSDLNAAVLSKYIAIRLRQRFQLKEALMPMLRHLSNNQYVKGFRIVCAGRFTRKEIALYDLRTYSSVPFSGVSSRLDFSLSEVVLKYSICGIKVWLNRFVLSERDFAIDAIGLQFISVPPITEDFFDNLKSVEGYTMVPYRPSSLDINMLNFFIKPGRNMRASFAEFASSVSPSFDFFFVDQKFRIYSKQIKIFSKFKKLKKRFLNV